MEQYFKHCADTCQVASLSKFTIQYPEEMVLMFSEEILSLNVADLKQRTTQRFARFQNACPDCQSELDIGAVDWPKLLKTTLKDYIDTIIHGDVQKSLIDHWQMHSEAHTNFLNLYKEGYNSTSEQTKLTRTLSEGELYASSAKRHKVSVPQATIVARSPTLNGVEKDKKATLYSCPPPCSTDSNDGSILVRERTLWEQWHEFLSAAANNEDLHMYSAEKHGIVVCGEKIRRKDRMPLEAYKNLCTIMGATERPDFKVLFDKEVQHVDSVLDADAADMLDAARKMASITTGEGRNDRLTFLSDLLVSIIKNVYNTQCDLSHSEAVLNEAIAWPALKSSLCTVTTETRGLTFFPGEEQLISMTTQLKNYDVHYDDRSHYKADAVLRCLDSTLGGDMELVLLETSNGYGSAGNKKINFDFHKGMYGTVAMLKTVADRYKYASFEKMNKLKLYFWHAHTKHIRLWSISCPYQEIFVMAREDKCHIPVKREDDVKFLLDYIGFVWSFKERLEETLGTLKTIEASHNENMKKYRYDPLPADQNLSFLVQPSIVKITERLHANFFVNDGPYSSPIAPPSP